MNRLIALPKSRRYRVLHALICVVAFAIGGLLGQITGLGGFGQGLIG